MELTFSDIHGIILNQIKHGISFTPCPVKKESDAKIKPSKSLKNLSISKAKEVIQERKKEGCSICKYNRCLAALEFHHKNPNQKSFAISKAHKARSLEELINELDKCILVCSNCHKEIHNNFVKIQ
jgi:hypothetical protein